MKLTKPEKYVPGSVVILDKMDDKQAPPAGTAGIVRNVDDLGTIHVSWTGYGSLGIVADVDECHLATDKEAIKVVVFEPGKKPYVSAIPNTLKSLQAIVGGYIQVVNPWPDKVLICNEEGFGLPPCCEVPRYGMIHGTFLVCGIQGKEFTSLSEEQIDQFVE